MGLKPAVSPGRDLVYGRKPVGEALRGKRAVHRLWAASEEAVPDVGTEASSESIGPAGTSTQAAKGQGARVDRASPDELTRLAGSPDHQGIVAEVDAYPYADPTTLLNADDALVLVLDQVQDPGNLGAICRTAEVAGASGVVIPSRRAAAVTAAVCKASAGAVEHLSVARVTNLAAWLGQAKEAGGWIHGAQSGADVAYTKAELTGRAVLVLGGEAKGLRPRVAKACDSLVAIPQHGQVGSLNVAAAAAVLTFEALRQRAAAE